MSHSNRSSQSPISTLPEVTVSDDGIVRYLHLGTPWVQGAMRIRRPLKLELEYIERMMAWLLFSTPENWEDFPNMPAMQLGLGAGALTKYHHQCLKMPTTVVEINPKVVQICHHWFKLPKPQNRPGENPLEIILGDAGAEIQNPRWFGKIHVLQIDLYDHEAAAPVLDDANFYAHCRRALRTDGILSINLFGRHHSFHHSVDKIASAFGAENLWMLRPTKEGNTIVLATATPQNPSRDDLLARAQAIAAQFELPAERWVKTLKPIFPKNPQNPEQT